MKLCDPKNAICFKDNRKVAKFDVMDEYIHLNMDYKSNLFHNKFVPYPSAMQIISKEDPNLNVEMDKGIQGMRANVIDAKIVQIMKARKKHEHNELVKDVINAV